MWNISIEAQRQNIYIAEQLARRSRIELEQNIECQSYLTELIESVKSRISALQCPQQSKELAYQRNREEVSNLLNYMKRGYTCVDLKKMSLIDAYWRIIFESKEYNNAIRSQEPYQQYLRDLNKENFVFNRVWLYWPNNGAGEHVDFDVVLSCYSNQTTYANKRIDQFMYNGGFRGFSYFEGREYFGNKAQYGSSCKNKVEVTPDQLYAYLEMLNRFPNWYINQVVSEYREKYFRVIHVSGVSANPLWWGTK